MTHEKSAYILNQEKMGAENAAKQERLQSALQAFQGLPPDALPPEWMMNVIGSHSKEHFVATAGWIFTELVRRGRLTRASRVIDLGSGCGRLALPFSFLIEEGRYFGTDVFEEGVAWCTENITSRNPAFEFHVQNVTNNYYADGQPRDGNILGLPFADNDTIDFLFAISVITHLVESDAKQYLNEIARVLHPGGLAYLTTFIIDRHFHAFSARTGQHRALKEISPGHYQAYSGQDFFGGYTLERWQELTSQAGLEIVSYDPGAWAEKPGSLHYQDTFLIVRK